MTCIESIEPTGKSYDVLLEEAEEALTAAARLGPVVDAGPAPQERSTPPCASSTRSSE